MAKKAVLANQVSEVFDNGPNGFPMVAVNTRMSYHYTCTATYRISIVRVLFLSIYLYPQL